MTPKQKAKELVYKYQYLVKIWDEWADESLEMIYRLPDMKECALIAVDEILDILNQLSLEYEYWQEVKQEIEKL